MLPNTSIAEYHQKSKVQRLTDFLQRSTLLRLEAYTSASYISCGARPRSSCTPFSPLIHFHILSSLHPPWSATPFSPAPPGSTHPPPRFTRRSGRFTAASGGPTERMWKRTRRPNGLATPGRPPEMTSQQTCVLQVARRAHGKQLHHVGAGAPQVDSSNGQPDVPFPSSPRRLDRDLQMSSSRRQFSRPRPRNTQHQGRETDMGGSWGHWSR